MTPAEQTDLLYHLIEKKRALSRESVEVQEKITALKKQLLESLSKEHAEGIIGQRAKAVIRKKIIPTAKDWTQIYKWIKAKPERFAVMQRRLAEGAIKEYWEDGKSIPGVDKFTIVDVSVTKKG